MISLSPHPKYEEQYLGLIFWLCGQGLLLVLETISHINLFFHSIPNIKSVTSYSSAKAQVNDIKSFQKGGKGTQK